MCHGTHVEVSDPAVEGVGSLLPPGGSLWIELRLSSLVASTFAG